MYWNVDRSYCTGTSDEPKITMEGIADASASKQPLLDAAAEAMSAPEASDMTRGKIDLNNSNVSAAPTSNNGIVVDIEGGMGEGAAKAINPDDYIPPPKPANAKCRLCDSGEDRDLLIKPCRCDGDQRYVHRDCLDQQRAMLQKQGEFVQCAECKYRYWIDVKEEYKPDEKCCGKPTRIWKFRGMVARDTVAIFFMLQIIIVLYAVVVEQVDSCSSMQGCGVGCSCDEISKWYTCPADVKDMCGKTFYDKRYGVNVTFGGPLLNHFSILNMNRHYKTTYYFAGLLFFLATLGVFVCCHSTCYFCNGGDGGADGYTNHIVDNYTCYYCFNDCPCCWSSHNSLGCCCYSNDYYYRPARYRPALGGARGSTTYNNSGDDCCKNCCDVCCDSGGGSGGSSSGGSSSGGSSSGGSSSGGGGGDCNCNCGGGGGDAAGVVLIIVVILVVIFAFIGFIYGLILLNLAITKIVQKHYAVAQRRVMTRNYIVRDLDGIYLPPPDVHALSLPCAPPINEVELQTFGLI